MRSNIWESSLTVNCPNDRIHECTVLWYVSVSFLYIIEYIPKTFSLNRFVCTNVIINGKNAKTLQIRGVERAHYAGNFMTINAPIGDNTLLHIHSDICSDCFKNSIINAHNTSTVQLTGRLDRRYEGTTLYVLYSDSVYIDCNPQNQGCQNLKIFIYVQDFGITNSYPNDRLSVNCVNDDDCINAELNILDDNKQWQCNYKYNLVDGTWNCIDLSIILSLLPSIPPTITPTMIPTKTPTIIPSYMPTFDPISRLSTNYTSTPTTFPTNIPSLSPIMNSPIIIPGNIEPESESNMIKLIVFIGALVIGCLISLCCCMSVLILCKKHGKNIQNMLISYTMESVKPNSPNSIISITNVNSNDQVSLPPEIPKISNVTSGHTHQKTSSNEEGININETITYGNHSNDINP